MKCKDTELIERTLEGDQHAFAALVEKYQEQIHALAWQKIGDFHIAQEITQDAFVTAYQKLPTLTHHNRFAGWLYVITSNKCNMWHRKKKPQLQSLEEIDAMELEEVYYTEYTSRQREEAANQNRRTIVQKLLSKLGESERTVVTMHYLAGLTCEEIGRFLGVSPNTVKSRLHRARERLKKEEEMIKENLSSFQLPTHTTENIMKEISNLNPVTPSGSKPLIPLAVSAASAILVVLLIGFGAQNLIRFQQPYSLESTSEQTIEIVDTQLVLDSPAEPSLLNKVGLSNIPSKSDGPLQELNAQTFAAAQIDESGNLKFKQQWVQAKGPEGGAVTKLFATTHGDIYAGTLSGLYRLSDDSNTWQLVNTQNALSLNSQNKGVGWGPMVERGDTLYLATDAEVLASTDRGETWKTLGTHPGGIPIGMVITDGSLRTQTEIAIYVALAKQSGWNNRNETAIFRSNDVAASWILLSNEEIGNEIRAIATIENNVFAGTEKGLFRLNAAGVWEQVSPGQADSMKGEELAIRALAVAERQLYAVIAGPKKPWHIHNAATGQGRTLFGWTLYRSTDMGESWTFIATGKTIMKRTHSKGYSPLPTEGPRRHQFPFTLMGPNSNIKIAAREDKILVIEGEDHVYSIDHGKTWTPFYLDDESWSGGNASDTIMLNANTFYRSGAYGIFRTTDGGKSWHKFNSGLTGTTILTLAVINDTLYALSSMGFLMSTDGGESWRYIIEGRESDILTRMVKVNDILYLRADGTYSDQEPGKMKPFFAHLSPPNNEMGPIPEIPDSNLLDGAFPGGFNFAISGDTFYMIHQNRLFRWKRGTSEWYNTGLTDTHKTTPEELDFDVLNPVGFKLAVSDKTVYVGKRDGKLMHSLDEGDTWNDVTANLPFSIDHFKAIAFAGHTVYISTDKGVVRSRNGTEWQTITDAEGTSHVIIRFAVEGTTLYGQAGQKVYQLKEGADTWKQITPEIPYLISCLDVDGGTLYVGTLGSGVLRYTPDDSTKQ